MSQVILPSSWDALITLIKKKKKATKHSRKARTRGCHIPQVNFHHVPVIYLYHVTDLLFILSDSMACETIATFKFYLQRKHHCSRELQTKASKPYSFLFKVSFSVPKSKTLKTIHQSLSREICCIITLHQKLDGA